MKTQLKNQTFGTDYLVNRNGGSEVFFLVKGLSAMAEDIQRDPSQVELVKNRGQVLFCWTDDQNNPEIVKYLKKLGVDGIIYDR